MTAEQKVREIDRQIGQCMAGEAGSILCPYCGQINLPNDERLCCLLMGKAVLAIMRRQEVQLQLELAEQIAEAVDKAMAN